MHNRRLQVTTPWHTSRPALKTSLTHGVDSAGWLLTIDRDSGQRRHAVGPSGAGANRSACRSTRWIERRGILGGRSPLPTFSLKTLAPIIRLPPLGRHSCFVRPRIFRLPRGPRSRRTSRHNSARHRCYVQCWTKKRPTSGRWRNPYRVNSLWASRAAGR